MSSVACRISTPWITAMGAGEDVTFKPVRDHIEKCLNCQAGVARQRRVRRSLADLGAVDGIAPVTRLASGPEPASRNRQMLVGAMAAAAIAVGVGVGLRRALAD